VRVTFSRIPTSSRDSGKNPANRVAVTSR